MISIQKAPYDCSFSKNPIEFELESNMRLLSAAVFPYLKISFSSALPAGTVISFSFTNPKSHEKETISIVATANPQQAWNFHDDTYFAGLSFYVDANASQLKKIPILNSFFNIKSDGTDLLIVAKEAIADLVIQELATTAGAEISMLNSTVYYDPEERDGYEMKAIIYFEPVYNSGTFERISDLNCFCDSNGIAQLDISGILNSEIERRMDSIPIPTETHEISKLLFRYYVEFVEYWTDQTDTSRIISKQYHVHWGGVSTDDQRMLEPMKYIQSTQQWLTWWPNGKELLRTQKDWLSWMNSKDNGTFAVVLRIKTSGSQLDHTIITTTLFRWQTITLSVGYLQKQIESYIPIGESLQSWSFFIKKGVKVVSDIRTYYLHANACDKADVLIWNSFGCPETFCALELEQSTEYTAQLANTASQFNNNRLKPDLFVFDSFNQHTLTARTTFLSTDERVKMSSIVNSMMCLVWRKKRWIPAVVNVSKKEDDVFLKIVDTLKIELLLANNDNRISFEDAIPSLKMNESCGIRTVDVIAPELEIDTYNNLVVTKDGVSYGTATWNATTNTYDISAPIVTNGNYLVEGTVIDTDGNSFTVSEYIEYKQKEIFFRHNNTGGITIVLKSSEPSATIDIDWGIGNGFETSTYTDALTPISKTVSVAGIKTMVLRKPCFDDIVTFNSGSMDLDGFDLNWFVNLERVYISNASWVGKLFLNPLTKLQRLQIATVSITGLEIGICPDLEYIILNSPSFDSNAVDDLVLNIWNFRKFFNNAISITITGTGLSFSALANSIISGTGDYVGEGLNSDYGFTLSIG